MVKVHGPYTPPRGPVQETQPADHYYVLVDATTGTILGAGVGPTGITW